MFYVGIHEAIFNISLLFSPQKASCNNWNLPQTCSLLLYDRFFKISPRSPHAYSHKTNPKCSATPSWHFALDCMLNPAPYSNSQKHHPLFSSVTYTLPLNSLFNSAGKKESGTKDWNIRNSGKSSWESDIMSSLTLKTELRQGEDKGQYAAAT